MKSASLLQEAREAATAAHGDLPSLQKPVFTDTYNYLLYLPHNFTSKKWPLIMFLHGAGEKARSNAPENLDLLKKNGIPKVVEKLPRDAQRDEHFPFIAVSPQAGYPYGYGWNHNLLLKLLQGIIKQHHEHIDQSRMYLTGISMGGYGTWRMAAEYPNVFAAVAPVCGGCAPDAAKHLVDMPIWNFHGKKDDIIPISESEIIIKALRSVGAKEVKYTVYPDAEHDSWTVTYDNPELYKWFLDHKRENCDISSIFPKNENSSTNNNNNNNNSSSKITKSSKGEKPAGGLSFQEIFSRRPVAKFEQKSNENILIDSARPNELIYVQNCNNCQVTVSSLVTKVIVERCQSTTVNFNSGLISGTCEIIACREISLNFNVVVPTITVDMTDGCVATFNHLEYQTTIPQIIWSYASNLSMKFHDGVARVVPAALVIRPDADADEAQFRSRLVNDQLENEFMIREGAGYLTTEREKEENDRRDAHNMDLFAQHMRLSSTNQPRSQ